MYNYYQIMTKHFHVLMLVIIEPKKNLQRTTPPPPPPPKKGERCLHTLVLYNSIYTRHVSVSHVKKLTFLVSRVQPYASFFIGAIFKPHTMGTSWISLATFRWNFDGNCNFSSDCFTYSSQQHTCIMICSITFNQNNISDLYKIQTLNAILNLQGSIFITWQNS